MKNLNVTFVNNNENKEFNLNLIKILAIGIVENLEKESFENKGD